MSLLFFQEMISSHRVKLPHIIALMVNGTALLPPCFWSLSLYAHNQLITAKKKEEATRRLTKHIKMSD